MGDLGVSWVEPRLVLVPALLQIAGGQQHARAGEPHHGGVGRGRAQGERLVAVGQGAQGIAACELGAGEVVAGLGEAGIEAQRLLVEDRRPLQVAVLVHQGAERVPEQRLARARFKRAAQDLDRLVAAAQVAERTGEVVQPFRMIGVAGQEMLEQLGGERLLAELEGEPAEVVGDLAVFGQELERALVAGQGVTDVAGLLAGDRQQPPAVAVALVDLKRADREVRRGAPVVPADRRHALFEPRAHGLRLERLKRVSEPLHGRR